MQKKISLLIVSLIALIFISAAGVSAAPVYVGVQINSATAPGGPDSGLINDNWCLPGGHINEYGYYYGTQMAITTAEDCSLANGNYPASTIGGYPSYLTMCFGCPSSGTPAIPHCIPAISPSTNPVYLTSPACPGGNKIWSSLLDLSNTSNYRVYLYTDGFCSGYFSDSGQCLETGPVNKSCDEICADYGQTAFDNYGPGCFTYGNGDNTNCSAIEDLKGSPCANCYGAAYSYYTPNPVDQTTDDCYYATEYTPCSTNPNDNATKIVCACNYTSQVSGFLIPSIDGPGFTP